MEEACQRRYNASKSLTSTCMVVKVIELVGVSADSFEGAVQQAVSGAAKTVRNITGVDVVGQTAKVEDGKITEYHANVKVAFTVNE